MSIRSIPARLVLLFALFGASPISAANFLVNDTGDGVDINPGDGDCWTGAWVTIGSFGVHECTLRAAIQETNALAGEDTIRFGSNLAPDAFGTIRIVPGTALPFVTGNVVIDGRTAPTYDATNPTEWPVIVLDGNASASGNGLYLQSSASGSEVYALAIIRWPGSGIVVADADLVYLQANHIGLEQGYIPRGNDGHGIQVTTGSSGVVIGERLEFPQGFVGRGNVISANGGNGIYVGGSNVGLSGNFIGTNAFGTSTNNLFGDYRNDGWGVRTYGTGSFIFIGQKGTSNPGGEIASGNTIAGNLDGGVLVGGSVSNVVLYDNHIGIGANGTTLLGNGTRSGVEIQVDGVVVGDETVGGNLISGNARYGIEVSTAVNGLEVVGNVIGLDEAEQNPIPNALEAILVIGGSNAEVHHNVIAGNGDDGLYLNGDDHVVYANHVGTNENGDDLGNGGFGIVTNGARNVIGREYAGNVVGFNDQGGISLDVATESASIYSNFIGIDPISRDIGNDGSGLVLRGVGNGVGGFLPQYANLIGNNAGHGIEARPGTSVVTIAGNHIGTDVALADHANAGAGIFLDDTSGATIGSNALASDAELVGRRNVIAWNTGDGVRITTSGSGLENAIRGNSFLGNAELPIDLANDGTTPNDAGDFDAGANGLQNSPQLDPAGTSFDWASSLLDVRYLVDSDASQSAYPIRVDFYTVAADGSSPGEFIGSDLYDAANAMDPRDVTIAPLIPLVGDETIVAVATDDDDNTSEVGNAIVVPEPGFGLPLAVGAIALAAAQRRRPS